jgi:hypothetical protein
MMPLATRAIPAICCSWILMVCFILSAGSTRSAAGSSAICHGWKRFFESSILSTSSSRRIGGEPRASKQLQRYFSADIQHRIIGATPQIDPNLVVRYRRQLEIQTWLDGNGRSGAEWVALDDWPGSFEAAFARLVLTDPKRAFDQDSFQELRSHFLRFAADR